MGKIVYSYYTPADAPAVTELFRRNAFGMGKYDPELTPERFIQNQEKKGFVFGIVGHDGDTAVTYVACYRNGSQRVCRAGQLIIGVMLIDKKFRSAMFSIADMFRMLLDRAENEGYLVLISEVATTNTSSLLLNRKTGALIFEAKPTVYGDYVLYDYMPSMLRHVCSHNVIETNIMPMLLRRISKAELLRETPEITAVFAMADVMAIGAARAVRDAGKRIPEDISLIGFDGLPICRYYEPRLSTVTQQIAFMAEKSYAVLLDMIENGSSAQHVLAPYTLEKTDSIRKN